VKKQLGLVEIFVGDLKLRFTDTLLIDKEVSEVRFLKITLVNSVVSGENVEDVCRDLVKSYDDEVTFRVENMPIVKEEFLILTFAIMCEEVSTMFEFLVLIKKILSYCASLVLHVLLKLQTILVKE
jgi:hypothetical protein